MVCKGIEILTDPTITDIISFPTSCDYYFYAKFFGALFIILTFILYRKDETRQSKPDMLSALGVSSIVVLFLAFLGSLVGMIPADVMVEMLVVGMIFIVIWLLKK